MTADERNENTVRFAGDALPDPEPAVPSLPNPDAGVFHHELDQKNTPKAEAEKHTK